MYAAPVNAWLTAGLDVSYQHARRAPQDPTNHPAIVAASIRSALAAFRPAFPHLGSSSLRRSAFSRASANADAGRLDRPGRCSPSSTMSPAPPTFPASATGNIASTAAHWRLRWSTVARFFSSSLSGNEGIVLDLKSGKPIDRTPLLVRFFESAGNPLLVNSGLWCRTRQGLLAFARPAKRRVARTPWAVRLRCVALDQFMDAANNGPSGSKPCSA